MRRQRRRAFCHSAWWQGSRSCEGVVAEVRVLAELHQVVLCVAAATIYGGGISTHCGGECDYEREIEQYYWWLEM